MDRSVRLRCPRCGEREDFFVRISALATLIRDASPADGLWIDISEKTPTDYEWIAFHCGTCGFEAARDEFEETAVDAMRSALEAFIRTIEATGGCIRPGPGTIDLPGEEPVELDNRPVPAGDPDWLDLADAYLLACRALGQEPKVSEQDADEILADGEGTADGSPGECQDDLEPACDT